MKETGYCGTTLLTFAAGTHDMSEQTERLCVAGRRYSRWLQLDRLPA